MCTFQITNHVSHEVFWLWAGPSGQFPNKDNKDDKLLLMNVVMHAADISNPAKSTAVYLRWTEHD